LCGGAVVRPHRSLSPPPQGGSPGLCGRRATPLPHARCPTAGFDGTAWGEADGASLCGTRHARAAFCGAYPACPPWGGRRGVEAPPACGEAPPSPAPERLRLSRASCGTDTSDSQPRTNDAFLRGSAEPQPVASTAQAKAQRLAPELRAWHRKGRRPRRLRLCRPYPAGCWGASVGERRGPLAT